MEPKEVYEVLDYLPWATPFTPGSLPPSSLVVLPGNYTLVGRVSGHAQVRFFSEASINCVAVNYTDYSDDKEYVLNGYEDVKLSVTPPKVWKNELNWYSDIVQTRSGVVTGKKATCANEFHLRIDTMTNIFEANGILTIVLGDIRYEQPADGT